MAYTAPVGLKWQRVPDGLESWLTKTPTRFAALLLAPVLVASIVASTTRTPAISPTLAPSGTGALIVSIGAGAVHVSGFDFSNTEAVEITRAFGTDSASEKIATETGAFRLSSDQRLMAGTKIMASDGASTAIVTIPAITVIATPDSVTGTADAGSQIHLSLDGPGVGLVETMLTVPGNGAWTWAPAGVKVTSDANIFVAHQGENGSSVEMYLSGAEALAGFSLS